MVNDNCHRSSNTINNSNNFNGQEKYLYRANDKRASR